MSESEVSYIPLLREGDEEAARKLWDDYFPMLVRFARRRLVGIPKGDFDEEDVASRALHSFCHGMAQGKYEGSKYAELSNRRKLRNLLFTITARKVSERRKHCSAQKRGDGRVFCESEFHSLSDGGQLDNLAGSYPAPAQRAIRKETRDNVDRHIEQLPCIHRHILFLMWDRYSAKEIADHIGCTRQTVYNKLEDISRIWSQDDELKTTIGSSAAYFRDILFYDYYDLEHVYSKRFNR